MVNTGDKNLGTVPEPVDEKTENPVTENETPGDNYTVEDIDENGIVHPPLPEPECFISGRVGSFGFSQQGKSHIDRDERCQDRFDLRIIPGRNITIAAVADGVGSCLLSDLGADCAVKSSLDYLEEKIRAHKGNPAEKEILQWLWDALSAAYLKVNAMAEEMQILLYSFQSTLTVAFYDGDILYYSHAGDDGIVALLGDGSYRMVTKRHKGEEASSVYPLQSTATWECGGVPDVAAFVMCTDGVLDGFVRSEVEDNRVYFPFIKQDLMADIKDVEDVRKLKDQKYDYMKSDRYRNMVTDDLTYVAVVNAQAVRKMKKKPVFDAEKWKADSLRYEEQRKRILYGPPVRQQDKNSEASSETLQEKSDNVSLPQQNNVSKPEEQLNLSVTKKTETGRYAGLLKIGLLSLIAVLLGIIGFRITHLRKPYEMNADAVAELRDVCRVNAKREIKDTPVLLVSNGKKVKEISERNTERSVSNINIPAYCYVDKSDEHTLYFVYTADLSVMQIEAFRISLLPGEIRKKTYKDLYGLITVTDVKVDGRGKLRSFSISREYGSGGSLTLYESEDEVLESLKDLNIKTRKQKLAVDETQ